MSRSDPLAILQLLRETEVEVARQHVALALHSRHQAYEALALSKAAVSRESVSAEQREYVAWLPAAQARLASLHSRFQSAEVAVVAAQASLAAAKLAQKFVAQARNKSNDIDKKIARKKREDYRD